MTAPDMLLDALPRERTGTALTSIDFVKVSPTGNATVLVRSRHDHHHYGPIASALMSREHLHAEQVGFAMGARSTTADAALQMAGDEFCANACMSLATLLASDAPPTRRPAQITLETTGVASPVHCRVRRGLYRSVCELTLPSYEAIEPFAWTGLSEPALLVSYGNAVHVVVECDPRDETARQRAQDVARQLAATHHVALAGVMLLDRARRRLVPLIYVPALDSMVWERSCGSGTGSVGVYLSTLSRSPVETLLHQPGGALQVRTAVDDNGVVTAAIAGSVSVVASGTAWVDV